MNEFLASLRADLTDRRLMPAVALVGVLLIAAIAYAALGGSGSAAPPASSGPVATPSPGIAVTSTTPEHAVAETTDGFKEQATGKARNPFAGLPGSAPPATTASSSSSTSSSSASSGTGSSPAASGEPSSAAGGTTPETGSKAPGETQKSGSKPKTVYDVSIEFGTLPPGSTPETAALTPFTKLKLQTPLPSAQLPLLVFRGVTPRGRTATFQLVGEAILSGTGHCLPSPTQCEAVDVKPGQTEQLSYLAPNGESTLYELRVLGIVPESPKAKGASRRGWAESQAGRQLLRDNGLLALPFLRYSSQPGVLVFPVHKASAARARVALVSAWG